MPVGSSLDAALVDLTFGSRLDHLVGTGVLAFDGWLRPEDLQRLVREGEELVYLID